MIIKIIINEKKEAERILSDGIISNKPSETISLLARYYRHEQHLRGKQIYNQIEAHFAKWYAGYNPTSWQEVIVRYVNKSKKYPLVNLDCVTVYEKEFEAIRDINNIRLERIAFTLLCCAKYYNLRNPNNNNWANISITDLFDSASVFLPMEQQCLLLNELMSEGYVSCSKKIDNLNLRVNYLYDENDSNVVMRIIDFRKLGLEYMNYIKGGYVNCKKCGVLFKQNKKNNALSCKECRGYITVDNRKIICCDCGEEFVVDSKNTRSQRCPACYIDYRREYVRCKVKTFRSNT